ncbi:MAG: 16S rRNA (uracil(1498)-N(3))-methyltransferase [Planctomycetes bacterium]|nr:16S rRNA (uracil(1498)-N(3))-methyltransferase [Planctomycetota bacterium]
MTARYYVEQPIETDVAVLTATEAHHLLHVMRGRAGDEVTLFDGQGFEFLARVTRCGRHEVELAVVERREVNRELSRRLVAAVALPKGDRQQWLVEKLVELGVAELIPLQTERSVAEPGTKALERLRRGVIEASKQCGRNRLMQIGEPRAWRRYVAEATTGCRLLAHPGHQSADMSIVSSQLAVQFAVGPEGGFTDEEANLAAGAGWQPVSLGERILRVETAAVALAARLSL